MADQQALYAFAQWVAGCSGNEKQEGQTFVQKLLTAWGWHDATEAGVSFEHRIAKGGPAGGVGFADALIPGKVLIEMKQRGEPLARHFPQLQRYWFNLAPKPTYAILCNFDEFWVFDFNQQVDEPIEKLQTAQLAERWPGLAFLSKQPQTPLFGNNQITVTEKQAQAMGHLFHELKQQAIRSERFTAQQAQRFVLQCVLCMFAEDREMLPNRQFSRALETCREKQESTYDVLGGLFAAMNTPGVTPGGRFKGTPYFNGGLFSEIPQIELSPEQLGHLIESAREDWRLVRPSIFGNIFEASSDDARRHALGQHFTSEPDILKVVRPTIIEPWEARIENAKTIEDLESLLTSLQAFRVLDPACGSGNFLYMAYNAIKDIETIILSRIKDRRRSEFLKGQGVLGFVSTHQFFGMDTDPFAVELARVTLMIARKVAHDRLGLTEQELPLDNLDKTILQADALFTPWPEADAIIGNPPFLGTHFMRRDLGSEYVERLYKRYPEMKDVDFCTHWFRKAHDALGETGRAGLVGTNSVREGKSRRVSLDYIIANGGTIYNAVASQRWSGDAKVFVSIVNWSRQPSKTLTLDGRPVDRINSSLRPGLDVTKSPKLKANKHQSFVGVQPNGKGFIIEKAMAEEWIQADSSNADVIRPYSMGANLADNPMGLPDRWIIDFSNRSMEEAEKYRLPFDHVRRTVRVERLQTERVEIAPGVFEERYKQNEEVLRVKWWRYKRTNERLRKCLAKYPTYLGVPRLSKWAVCLQCQNDWLPGDLVVAITTNDVYVQGVLTSMPHRQWVECQKSTLKGDTRYTHTTCFETFPFPQQLTAEQADTIRQAMTELNNYRNAWMVERQAGITELYNRYFDEPASRLRKLHEALDVLVLKAYGWGPNEDVLKNLLDLNLELSALEGAGQVIDGPSITS